MTEATVFRNHIKEQLALSTAAAFSSMAPNGEAVSSDDIYKLLEQPPESNLGDYALPCFRFAKALRKKPQDIAQDLSQALLASKQNPWIERTQVVGAFLNFVVNKTKLAQHLLPQVLDDSYFKKAFANKNERVMVEYSQPNTHKEFHVGHVRNVCLGDAICRIYNYLGYEVIAANYIGDEGTHVAKCLWQIQAEGGSPPEGVANRAEWYGKCYAEASRRLHEATPEQKKIFEKEISQTLVALEAKSGDAYKLWLTSKQACMDEFHRIYSWLDVHFDHYFYESQFSEDSQRIVDEFLKKGLFKVDQGAVGIDMNDDGLGFFMVRKSDGTTLYITKDLVLAREKFEKFNIQRSIYVVAMEQNLHFKQLFKALDMMGFQQASQCYHLSYAHVTLPEGKMSSRGGRVVTFSSLKSTLEQELSPFFEKYEKDWSASERQETIQKVAVAAMKYGMLASDPLKEITFEPKLWTSFEGNSGPYLVYSYARTCSILNKCKEQNFHASLDHLHTLDKASEHDLIRTLYDFNEVVLHAGTHYKPSVIAHHLFAMCKTFNRFYAEVSILRAETAEERGALLALVNAFAKTLKEGLVLIGITPVERM